MKKVIFTAHGSLLMWALWQAAMAAKVEDAMLAKLEDSISLQFGELIGSQIKMMGDQGLEPSEILKGLEAAAKLVKNDTSKRWQEPSTRA